MHKFDKTSSFWVINRSPTENGQNVIFRIRKQNFLHFFLGKTEFTWIKFSVRLCVCVCVWEHSVIEHPWEFVRAVWAKEKYAIFCCRFAFPARFFTHFPFTYEWWLFWVGYLETIETGTVFFSSMFARAVNHFNFISLLITSFASSFIYLIHQTKIFHQRITVKVSLLFRTTKEYISNCVCVCACVYCSDSTNSVWPVYPEEIGKKKQITRKLSPCDILREFYLQNQFRPLQFLS